MAGVSETVSFRLSPQFAQRLDTEAAKRGMSRGDYARHLVIDGLSGRRVDELSADIAELRSSFHRVAEHLLQSQQQLSDSGELLANLLTQQASAPDDNSRELSPRIAAVDENVIRLREDFATGLVALLVHACHWELDEAVRWVDAKLINK